MQNGKHITCIKLRDGGWFIFIEGEFIFHTFCAIILSKAFLNSLAGFNWDGIFDKKQ